MEPTKSDARKIIVSDLEGTLTTGESWRGIRRYYRAHRSPLAYDLFLARFLPRMPLLKLGLLDRRKTMAAWLKAECALFRAASSEEFNAMAQWVVDEVMWPQRRADVCAELEARREAGARIIVVSGAYQPIVDAFSRHLHAEGMGTQLHFAEDKLQGILPPINWGEKKLERIRARYPGARILAAYGDSLSDLPMMLASEQPVAVYPQPALRQMAVSRGWRIIPHLESAPGRP